MSDREALLEAFERGALVRPSADHTCFVDVVRAVMHAAGAAVPLGDHARDLASRLQGVEHIVFVLADGLGIDLVDRMPRRSWIRTHTRRAIHAPFPSTTTTAVTSIMTAEHPTQHAIGGWWVHLPALDGPATVFAHDRALDGRSLHDLGIEVGELSPAKPIFGELTRDTLLVVPSGIVDSPYTERMADGHARQGYRNYREALDAVLRHIEDATGPTFTYWYTASPDSEAHDEGTHSDQVEVALAALDDALDALATGLAEQTDSWRIVGTADHGHLELDPHLELEEDDALLALLRCPPSGDMRVQYWHVRPEAHEAFVEAFRGKLGEHFFLLPVAEVQALGLYGPDGWSEAMHQRTGDFISISRGRAALRYAGIPGRGGFRRMRSGHSGLSPEEILIPLVIAGEDRATPDFEQ